MHPFRIPLLNERTRIIEPTENKIEKRKDPKSTKECEYSSLAHNIQETDGDVMHISKAINRCLGDSEANVTRGYG